MMPPAHAMSAPPQGPPQAQPAGTSPQDASAPEGAPAHLHDLAMECASCASQIATGLARLSADPAAVQAVTQCAQLMHNLAKGLAQQGLQGTQGHAAPPQQAAPAHQSIGGATNDLYASLHH